MNILITGGAGFIGSHVVRRIVNKYPQYNIVNLDALTYAGNLEKANYLAWKRGELQAIARRVSQHVQNGEMTVQLAAGITQYIETIESLEYQARAEAHRREAVKFFAEGNMSGLDRQLTEAERALQDVDRMSRNLEAISVNLSAGVNRDMREDDEWFGKDDSYAKLTVSYRLGAINPNRSRYEQEAERARLDALNEEGQGSLRGNHQHLRAARGLDLLPRARRERSAHRTDRLGVRRPLVRAGPQLGTPSGADGAARELYAVRCDVPPGRQLERRLAHLHAHRQHQGAAGLGRGGQPHARLRRPGHRRLRAAEPQHLRRLPHQHRPAQLHRHERRHRRARRRRRTTGLELHRSQRGERRLRQAGFNLGEAINIVITGSTVDRFSQGISFSGVGTQVSTTVLRGTQVAVHVEGATGALLDGLYVDAADVPPETNVPGAILIQLGDATVRNLTTEGAMNVYGSVVAAMFDSSVTLDGARMSRARVGARLDGPRRRAWCGTARSPSARSRCSSTAASTTSSATTSSATTATTRC